ncbi:MAG: WD40/YVTN/BNR-like repeat-containing protein [Thermodesulfobacteriota bacterium]
MQVGKIFRIVNTFIYCFILVALTACASRITSSNTPPAEDARIRRESNQIRIQRVGNLPLAQSSYHIQFASQREGWLSSKEKLWRTLNGGLDWELIFSSDARAQEIRNFGFLNLRIGWMLRWEGIYITEDRGFTWIKQPSTLLDHPKGTLHSVTFTEDGKIGWAIGGLYRPISRKDLAERRFPNNTVSSELRSVLYGAIFSTDNGGISWRQLFISSEPGRFLCLAFLDIKRGIVVGDAGVYYTDNGGNQWKEAIFNENCTNLKDKNFFEQTPVYVNLVQPGLGWLSFNNGLVLKSTDGGQAWCDLLRPEQVWARGDQNAYFKKIHFLDSTHGWGLKANGSLCETKDGGETWEEVEAKIKFDDMYFLDTNNGWVVAKVGMFRILL